MDETLRQERRVEAQQLLAFDAIGERSKAMVLSKSEIALFLIAIAFILFLLFGNNWVS